MSDLYDKNEALGKTKVDESAVLQSAGDYLAVLGRTRLETNKKTLRVSIVMDLFLVNRTSKDGASNVKIMEVSVKEGKQTLSFLTTPEGVPKIWGTQFRVNFPEPLATDKDGARNYFATMRKKVSRALGAFDDTNSVVDWGKIQKMAGRFLALTLVENGDYLNLDPKSVSLYEQGSISEENLKAIYETIEVVKAQKAAEKNKSAATSASPLPDDVTEETKSKKSGEKDDGLPF